MGGNDNRLEYEKRVNRVIDYVRAHLAEPLSLATLADVAVFSPFHFHRVFTAMTGETLFGFIQRLRIEHAAIALDLHRDRSVLAVAIDHGFSSAATFARAFRARFGMTATEWRDGGAERWRTRRDRQGKTGKHLGKGRKAPGARRANTAPQRRGARRAARGEAVMSVQIQLKDVPPQHVAYMRHVGPYGPRGIPELWNRFARWMAGRDLHMADTVRLGIAYDDPSVTAAEQLRYDACVVVPVDFAADRWVNLMDVPGGRFAAAPFVGTARDITRVWDSVFRTWLPQSGFQPDDRPCFELYRGNPMVDDKGTFRCELYMPVRPL
jgi:AraC family transcriptional regulator